MSFLLHLIEILQEPELLLDVLSHVVVALRLDDVQAVLGDDGQLGDHRLQPLLGGVRDQVQHLLGGRLQALIMIMIMIMMRMRMIMMGRSHLLFTDPGNLLAEEPGLQEGLVLARPDEGPDVGGADPAGLVSDVDSPHGGHVVDVVVPRG